ncbi:MAG: hypothetical protein K0S53_84 [Bacteroidetes bacterium]|jgi:hypothetical protein|nr:hypothetical protein [Bacteroidota bacterium]MDF2453325.1 hypothetical protein [Bacteroidota bacterium]
MLRYPKLYLLLSSLLFLSCSISKYKSNTVPVSEKLSYNHLLPVINPGGSATKYKATIDVLNKHFSGLVIVKRTDSITTHVVFITELGMKMFDLEKKDTAFNMVYVFEPMNKPNLVSVLKTNFKNMLLMDIYGKDINTGMTKKRETVYELIDHKEKRYFIVKDANQLVKQANFFKQKKSSLVNYTYNAEIKSYEKIQSLQYGLVKVRIELNAVREAN